MGLVGVNVSHILWYVYRFRNSYFACAGYAESLSCQSPNSGTSFAYTSSLCYHCLFLQHLKSLCETILKTMTLGSTVSHVLHSSELILSPPRAPDDAYHMSSHTAWNDVITSWSSGPHCRPECQTHICNPPLLYGTPSSHCVCLAGACRLSMTTSPVCLTLSYSKPGSLSC